ncbi:putative protein kinase [Trypanosoma rangeli]|uniref:Protein kinase n=1 Tax=Trypanosoma rangeli TaxID=5698 RepID=A0A3R7NIP6_TRYRA|nr:putative protein kinase [Trypanosoma rangeli]RNF03197.1 putative protein kinase [Trypanosoma rangeli]|eukprot:RNF03197.1 putative protein kinase [Trypanosoma rangeli]
MSFRSVEDNAGPDTLSNSQSTLVELSVESHTATSERPWGFLLSDKHRVLYLSDRRQITCGRSPTCDIVVSDPRVSALHFVIAFHVEVSVPSPGRGCRCHHQDLSTRQHTLLDTSITAGSTLVGAHNNSCSTRETNDDAHHTQMPRYSVPEVRIYLEDHSANGTYVNDTKVGKGRRCQLQSGDDVGVVACHLNTLRDEGRAGEVGNTTDYSSLIFTDKLNMSLTPGSLYVEKFCFQAYHTSDNTATLGEEESWNARLGPGSGRKMSSLRQSVKEQSISIRLQWGLPIAHGANSVVYAGMDVDTGRRLALKVIHDDGFSSSSSPYSSKDSNESSGKSLLKQTKVSPETPSINCDKKKLDSYHGRLALSEADLREFYFLTYLAHHRIVKCLGVEKVHRGMCIILEHVAGGTLQDLIKKFGAFNENVIRLYTLQVLQGMEYLQRRSVVHGDLKSANVLVTEKGNLKITDFGTSRFVQTIYVADAEQDKLLGGNSGCFMQATERKLCGTPIYMSPELISTQESTFASDVWALGCMVYEMTMGVPPWEEFHGLPSHTVVWRIGGTVKGPSLNRLRQSGASLTLLNFIECVFRLDYTRRPSVEELLKHPFILGHPPVVCSQSLPLLSPSSLEWSPKLNSSPMQMHQSNAISGTNAAGEKLLHIAEEVGNDREMELDSELGDLPHQELLELSLGLGPEAAAEVVSAKPIYRTSPSTHATRLGGHQALICELNLKKKFGKLDAVEAKKRQNSFNGELSSLRTLRRRLEGVHHSQRRGGGYSFTENVDTVGQGGNLFDSDAASKSHSTAEFLGITALFKE